MDFFKALDKAFDVEKVASTAFSVVDEFPDRAKTTVDSGRVVVTTAGTARFLLLVTG